MSRSLGTWSRAFGALFALIAPAVAAAGACCAGATSAMPLRIGECEQELYGFGLAGEVVTGLWDRSGALKTGLPERVGLLSFGAATRFDRRWQLAASLPVRLTAKGELGAALTGGGPGDLSAIVGFRPREEHFQQPLRPVPFFTFGVRAPTGRDWTASESPLLADVTGLGQAAVNVGASWERTVDTWPWSVGSTAELGYGPAGLGAVWGANAMLGRTLGPGWSVAGSARYAVAWADLSRADAYTARTTLGARLIHGKWRSWRTWVGVEGDPAIAGLGHSMERRVSASWGAVVVR